MNAISWFEIPAFDIHRASAFYTAIHGFPMEISQNGDHTMALFPAESGVGGAIVAGPGCTPSDVGVLIYLDVRHGLDAALAQVEPAGGRVVMMRSFISEQAGSFALIIDTEGNRIALHEPPPATEAPKTTAAPKTAAATAGAGEAKSAPAATSKPRKRKSGKRG